MADTDDTAAAVAASRQAQGLPAHVEDVLTLDALAELFRQNDEPKEGAA